MEVNIYHRYDKLDKIHEYQIVVPAPSIWSQWLWYCLGIITGNRELKYRILPYYFEYISHGKTKLIYSYKGINAYIVAARVFLKIEKDFSKRRKNVRG